MVTNSSLSYVPYKIKILHHSARSIVRIYSGNLARNAQVDRDVNSWKKDFS